MYADSCSYYYYYCWVLVDGGFHSTWSIGLPLWILWSFFHHSKGCQKSYYAKVIKFNYVWNKNENTVDGEEKGKNGKSAIDVGACVGEWMNKDLIYERKVLVLWILQGQVIPLIRSILIGLKKVFSMTPCQQ